MLRKRSSTMQRAWILSLVWMTAATGFAASSGHWRGSGQDGDFRSGALPDRWSPVGENLLWTAPFGSRSSPLVMDGRVFLINRAGKGERLQERVMALDFETGKMVWEHRFNVFLTDIVAHRVGWANLAGDPETGYIYAHGVQGLFFCFDRDGNVIWSRSLTEEVGRISGYGGRTNTPTVEGDLVLISFLNSSWGPQGKGSHRVLAMDKKTGEMIYWAEPSGKPLDTTYSVPVVQTLDGERRLFTGLADGAIVSLNPATGERLWQFPFSKRGINSSVVAQDGRVFATHSEENLDSTQMGRVVCLDARTGQKIWQHDGLAPGYASPALHDGVLYVPHNSANLHAFDASTGKHLWEFNYGKEAKGSPVYSDGKIFVGEVGGTYHILKATREGCESLHEVSFREPSGAPIEIFGTPAVAGNRVLLPTRTDLYCIGLGSDPAPEPDPEPVPAPSDDVRKVARVRLEPAECWIEPGESKAFSVIGMGQGITERTVLPAAYTAKGLAGTFDEDGLFHAAKTNVMQAGTVTATAGALSASARVRIIPRLPYREDFESMPAGDAPPGYITSKLKAQVMELDGGKVLRKMADRPAPPFARLRCYMMPPLPDGYTVKADILGVSKKKRFVPDIGLINCRYLLILTGSSERTPTLRLVSWAPIPRIQKDVEFPWDPDTWYAVKLSVAEGVVRGKVWPRGEDEPDAWSIEMTDPSPNREGSPGLYAYSVGITSKSKGTEVLFDNVEIARNAE
jgi:outer membrane protein assembly factor BamB